MKILKRTFLIIFTLIITTQTFRHVYVKFIEPKVSVLDKYKNKTEKNIYLSKNIAELEILYKNVNNKVIKYEINNKPINSYNMRTREPYKSKFEIKEAIQSAERINKMLFELRFYWMCGLIAIIIGLIIYIKINKYMGFSTLLIGLFEIATWTSPLFRGYGRQLGLERLLNEKLFFSVLSFLIMLVLWLLNEKINKEN